MKIRIKARLLIFATILLTCSALPGMAQLAGPLAGSPCNSTTLTEGCSTAPCSPPNCTEGATLVNIPDSPKAQDKFAVRLGASIADGPRAGVLEFLIGQGDLRSKSTIVASRDAAGKITQAFATGIERRLFTVGPVTFAASGQAGVAYNQENVSGLAQGATTLIIKAWRNLSFVVDGVGANIPAEGGSWDGQARFTAEWEF